MEEKIVIMLESQHQERLKASREMSQTPEEQALYTQLLKRQNSEMQELLEEIRQEA